MHLPSISTRRKLGLAGTALATLAGILTVSGIDAQAATAPTPGTTPYVRLFTQVDNPGEVRTVNELTGAALEAKLDDLTSWYVHFHAEASNKFPLGKEGQGKSTTTLASKLTARGAWVSNYRNGSYVSQSSTSAPAGRRSDRTVLRRQPTSRRKVMIRLTRS